MKKIFTILVLISWSYVSANNFNKSKNNQKKIIFENTCKIIEKNVYDYCKNKGYSEEDSKAMSASAYKKCTEKVNKLEQY